MKAIIILILFQQYNGFETLYDYEEYRKDSIWQAYIQREDSIYYWETLHDSQEYQLEFDTLTIRPINSFDFFLYDMGYYDIKVLHEKYAGGESKSEFEILAWYLVDMGGVIFIFGIIMFLILLKASKSVNNKLTNMKSNKS